jgi:predicted ArsR family transcriptional regulator
LCAEEAGFSQVAKNCQVICEIVGRVFKVFLPKIKDANSIWQTVGDA